MDIALLNNPARLRERADAIDAWNAGNPVDKFVDGKWIQIVDQTAFFFDRRYRARPMSDSEFQKYVNASARLMVGSGNIIDATREWTVEEWQTAHPGEALPSQIQPTLMQQLAQ